MNETNNNVQMIGNSTLADITAMGKTAAKFDASALPEVCYFRVQSRGAVGTYKNGLKERAVGAWAVLVSCKDGKGLRLATDVAFEKGMRVKGEFKTREEAIAAGKDMIAEWGKAKAAKAEKKAKAKMTVDAVLNAIKSLSDEDRTKVMATMVS